MKTETNNYSRESELLRESVANIAPPDMDGEWQRLQLRIQGRKDGAAADCPSGKERRYSVKSIFGTLSFRKVAAIAALMAVVAAGGSALLLKPAVHTDVETIPAEQSAQAMPEVTTAAMTFEASPLDSIMQVVASDLGIRVVFANDSARAVRLHLTVPAGASAADIADLLNNFDEITATCTGEGVVIL